MSFLVSQIWSLRCLTSGVLSAMVEERVRAGLRGVWVGVGGVR